MAITSAILLLVMVFSSTVIGKGWLSEEEIKKIAYETADSAVQHDMDSTGKQIRSFCKLDFDSIQIIPVTSIILMEVPPMFPSLPTLNEDHKWFYLVKYFKDGLLVGEGKIDVYGGDRYPGVKNVMVREPHPLPEGIFDQERAKKIFEEKTGESVCLITLAQYYIEPVTIHTGLGIPYAWWVFSQGGPYLMSLSGDIKPLYDESEKGR
ncbi:MAG: hypothetical protein WBD28_02870 [Candidatus Zixiibacteriota bacterium]